MIWWAEQPRRAQSERAAISELADKHDWLQAVVWMLTGELQIAVDFELVVNDRVIPLTLDFPEFFPDVVPSVVSREKERLSGHQYGPSGELCLEYRSDNWMPEITGAMMIESAHRLLSSEQETGEPALSDHRVLPAQRARNSKFRFLYSRAVWAGLLSVEEGHAVDAELQEHHLAGVYAAQLARMGPTEEPIWQETNRRGYGATSLKAKVVRLPEGAAVKCRAVDELVALLEQFGLGELASDLVQEPSEIEVILFDGQSIQALMMLGQAGAKTLINYDLVFAERDGARLDPAYVNLGSAKVAIVGCGSLGSKVAVQLARVGVGKFVLVDGDILAVGNLVRNELDWRAVGMHKSQALAARVNEVNADCEVLTRTTVLGGQESGGSTANTMEYIADCDLIIDATADPAVFNLCSAIARRAKKSLCWAQVFGGGAGGIVVRLRPDIDPTPLETRRRIEAWYATQGVEWPDEPAAQPYAGGGESGVPLIADDADVTVIAAHLSRFATDLLARPEATIFPYSAYLIGLSGRWLFTAPFDVRPIDLGPTDGWSMEVQDGDVEAFKEFFADLLPKANDAS